MKHFFLSESLVNALGWTLLHTLWQGALLALLVWVMQTRQRDAASRFWSAYAALSLQLIAAMVTFAWMYDSPAVAPETPKATLVAIWNETALSPQWPVAVNAGIAGQVEQWYPLLVTLWLSGLSFFLLRLLGGFWWLRRLQIQGKLPDRPVWAETLGRLQAQMAVSRPVRLLASALIQTPMTLGFLRPVILIPVAMVNSLSPEEAEAILAHELAHILRRDWLLNLWQALIESLFYYHPAVWWLAAQARQEREHCCDDLAVQCTGNRLAYAKALVRVQELGAVPAPLPALGMSGHSRSLWRRPPVLLHRIRRLLQPPTYKIELMEKLTASAILLALLALLGLRTQTAPLFSTLQAVTPDPLYRFFQVDPDTVPPSESPKRVQKITRDDGRQKVDMELKNGKITRLVIDGKEIPSGDYDQYRTLTNEILADTPPPPPAPAPPAPPAIWSLPAPPAPPAPAWAPAPPPPPVPSIRNDRDTEGNLLLQIERNGEPVEIIVKGNEVWLNGEPLPPGAEIPLPGLDEPFFFGPMAPGVRVTPGEAPLVACENELMYRLLAEQEAMQRRLQTDMESHHRLEEQQLRAREFSQLERQHARAEQQRALEMNRIHHQEAMEEQHRALELQRKALDELRATERAQPYFVFPGRDFSSVLVEQLTVEGLITNPARYKVEFSGKSLKVNGKKQPDELHRRYLELYRSMTGKRMGEKDNIQIKKG